MRLRSILPVLSISVAVLVTTAFAVDFDPEIQQLEKSFQAEVQDRINTYFGPDSKILVSIRATEAAKPPVPKSNESEAADLGYAPFPFQSKTAMEAEAPKARKLSISELKVHLQVPEGIEQEIIQQARKLVQSVLQDVAHAITVTQVAAKAPKKPDAERDPAAAEKPKSILESINWAILIPSLGAALILGLSIMILASALRYIATSISDSLRSANGALRVTNLDGKAPDKVQEPEGEGLDLEAKPEPAPLPQAISITEDENKRNLGIIQRLLADHPGYILQAISDDEADLLGFKWILPNLSDKEQDCVRKIMGPARLARIAALATCHTAPAAWLRGFVERVMIRKLEGESKLEAQLGPELANELRGADRDRLFKTAREIGSAAAWRIYAHFAGREHINSVATSLSPDEWNLLVSGGAVAEQDIQSVGQQILKKVGESPGDLADREKLEYFSKVLLDPIVEAMESKGPGSDETFLDSVASGAPEFGRLIRERLWTVSHLLKIPVPHLASAVKNLTHEQKAQLIWVLPDHVASVVHSVLPEGNVKLIVDDQLKKLRAGADNEQRQQAIRVYRRFMDFLRAQADARKFQLLSDENAPPRMAA